jgi:hypothetical protein
MSRYLSDSGHGGQIDDESGEEEDGFNEGEIRNRNSCAFLLSTSSTLAIFPLDYRKAGPITDNVRGSLLRVGVELTSPCF